jgi:hypothetical protein
MDREKRKQIALAVLIILVISLSVLYFLWGTVIDYGKISIEGDTPFSVEVFGSEQHQCDLSPCELKLRGGISTLIFRKDEHESFLIEQDVKMWKTLSIEAKFEIKPQITTAQSLPIKSAEKEFTLTIDGDNGMQKLVDSADSRSTSIVYFKAPLENYQIFSTKDFALIQSEDQLYKVDTQNNKKTALSQFSLAEIEESVFSDDGKYLIVRAGGEISIINTVDLTIQDLDFSNAATFAWTNANQLIFVTKQTFSVSSAAGKYGENYINLLTSDSESALTFGTYHPDEDSYTKIEKFTEIKEVPTELIPLSNGRAVYFQSEEQVFKIILEKL